MPLQLTFHKLRKLDDKPKPEIVGYGKILQCLHKSPESVRVLSYNHMSPIELYTNLLLDNPKINYTKSCLSYVKYLKDIGDQINEHPQSELIINMFGVNARESWQLVQSKEHLLEIAINDGIFWEFISWDCPFVITLLNCIQNNDSESLVEYIHLYDCLQANIGIYIFEYLVRYAYDFRRLKIIETIIQEFVPLLLSNEIKHAMGDCLASLMKYFTENQKNGNPRMIIRENADMVKLVEILESLFPDIYTYFQIDWSGYLFYLVKNENTDKIVEFASKLKKPYTSLDYEIVIYALFKKLDAIASILLTGFDWNDRRNELEKARLNDLSKPDLEKMVYYLLTNIENTNISIGAGFDPSSVCYAGKIMKQSHQGINMLYQQYEKRFHMTIYLKSLDTRTGVMQKWSEKINDHSGHHLQSIINDLEQNMQLRNALEANLKAKLNRSIRTVNKHHKNDDRMPILIHQLMDSCGIMYKCEQYDNPDVKVV